MKHVNFIEIKPISRAQRWGLELNYWVMIWVGVAMMVVALLIHWAQAHHISSQQQELASLHAAEPTVSPEQTQAEGISGVEWSKFLAQYSAQFPEYVHLNKISGSLGSGRKLTFEATTLTASDASRAKRHLARLGICTEVHLNNLRQVKEEVVFELECGI